jgi:hypothetical protein
MTRLLLLAALLGAALGVRTVGHTFAASAASDAAHLCQQGGYASLMGTDGTTFQNAGQCTSYVARGGTIMNVPACTVVAGVNGCLTLDNFSMPYFSDGLVDNSSLGTIALTGLFSFSPTASSCDPCSGAASGGGTYTLSPSSTFNGGASSGTFSVTSTTLTDYETNSGPSGTQTTCGAAGSVVIFLAVTFTSQTGSTTSGSLHLDLVPAGATDVQIHDAVGTTLFDNPSSPSGVTYSC